MINSVFCSRELVSWRTLAVIASFFLAINPLMSAELGTHLRYLVLTTQHDTRPPFPAVDFIYGPQEKIGHVVYRWWQLQARTDTDLNSAPLFVLRGLTSADPLAAGRQPLLFARYLLKLPTTGECLDYRDCHSGQALLPAWTDFEKYFVPAPASAAQRQNGSPQTCAYLGHVLTLLWIGTNVPWVSWADVKRLDLDREMLVGTGRNFKDAEGRRLPQKPERRNYTYVQFTSEDYRMMIEAGMNLFTVAPEQEIFVRAEPVFYLRGVEGKPPLNYPADLYRANYVGPVMFMDEPSILTVGDTNIHRTLRYFSDAAALFEKRTRVVYESSGGYGAFYLEKCLQKAGLNLGDMRLMQSELPSWETLYDTTFYQMKGGGSGLVHEGRYQVEEFNQAVERVTGIKRAHTPREVLQYHYALLRGGTRPFGKYWGTAIYGQCDPALAPEAFTLAYDMGARYFWFWTSDHDHHVPWPEQLELARHLKEHARLHPRLPLSQPPPKRDTTIVIPNGYFLSMDNLWWVRALDKEGKNEAAQKYRRLMQRALRKVHECFDRGRDFDITVDDGRPIKGYRRIVRIDDRE
jgi:hypothetical protein